jgi:hypothetical protein
MEETNQLHLDLSRRFKSSLTIKEFLNHIGENSCAARSFSAQAIRRQLTAATMAAATSRDIRAQ